MLSKYRHVGSHGFAAGRPTNAFLSSQNPQTPNSKPILAPKPSTQNPKPSPLAPTPFSFLMEAGKGCQVPSPDPLNKGAMSRARFELRV